jgi:hypothetical protein
MPAVFCLRLAAGMLACLLLLPPAVVNPRFYRTHFLTALGLSLAALLLVRQAAAGPVLALLGAGVALCFLGSLAWSLEGAPGTGQDFKARSASEAILLPRSRFGLGWSGPAALIAVTVAALAAGLGLLEAGAPRSGPLAPVLLGDGASAALLGAALTAMLLGHSYLIAPAMSIRPLLRLLAVLVVTVVVRAALDGHALWRWTDSHALANLGNETLLWLPVRWAVGFAAPLALIWMAWQTARIRSTQSATGILYVVVIFCFLGELTALLLREAGVVL